MPPPLFEAIVIHASGGAWTVSGFERENPDMRSQRAYLQSWFMCPLSARDPRALGRLLRRRTSRELGLPDVTEDLRALDDWLAPLLAGIAPSARRRLALELAREIRRHQQQRIAAQLNPDGTRYGPRKATLRDRIGKVRRGTMFAKLQTATHLRIEASPDEVSVGFAGRVARIASVHQLGLRDRVQPDGPEVQYAARRLLGLTTSEREGIRDRIQRFLAQ